MLLGSQERAMRSILIKDAEGNLIVKWVTILFLVMTGCLMLIGFGVIG